MNIALLTGDLSVSITDDNFGLESFYKFPFRISSTAKFAALAVRAM